MEKARDTVGIKKEIQEILFKRISYPLFLLLAGIDVQVPKKLEEAIPQYEVEVLKSLAVEDLDFFI